jgi:tetratricopeptide (TPR) repeat protein
MNDPDGIDDRQENERAVRLLQQAYERQRAGDLKEAIRLYKASIALRPTAEAHTYLGWTYSFMHRYQEAIRECEAAIRIDPDFGNPYNDIGSYLIHLGRLEEAIPWLEKAKAAPRYEPRHFPYLNLYRAYTKLNRPIDAQRELQQAQFIEQGIEAMTGSAPDEDQNATLN